MITHPDKVLFPEDGITKGELADYYAAIAEVMVPHVAGRPVTMERFPAGIDKKGFIQKDVSKGFPEWLERVEVPKQGGVVHHPLVNDARSLEWVVNQNCITLHIWTRRVADLAHPDVCLFDLDPPDGKDSRVLIDAALALRDLLGELGLTSWVKTTGSKGFHIAVPLDGSADLRTAARFADAVGTFLVRRHPAQLTQEFHKIDRDGRILVDTGRNNYSATFAAPYTVRPKDGAPISAPCTWQEIETLRIAPQSVTVRSAAARLKAVGDLWKDMAASGQPLAPAIARLKELQDTTAAPRVTVKRAGRSGRAREM